MSEMTRDEIMDHVSTIQITVDPRSPFYGKVDLSYLLHMPIEEQQLIFDAMPPKTLKQLQTAHEKGDV